jgi:AraC-like DNA-binding protein
MDTSLSGETRSTPLPFQPAGAPSIIWSGVVMDRLQCIIGAATAGQFEVAKSRLTTIPAPRCRFESLFLRYVIADVVDRLKGTKDQTQRSEEGTTRISALAVSGNNPLAPLSTVIANLETRRSRSREVVCRTKEYVRGHYDQRLTLHLTAERLGVSAVELNRAFVEVLGMSFRRYVTLLRVRRGLRAVSTGMKAEVAALLAGYKSKKDFYRAVRLTTGLTPREAAYRKMRQAR